MYVVPFEAGIFGKPRLMKIGGCKLTAGLFIQDRTTAIVACNQNHELSWFDLRSGDVRIRLRRGRVSVRHSALIGNRIAVSNWGQSSVTVIDTSSVSKVTEIKVGRCCDIVLYLAIPLKILIADLWRIASESKASIGICHGAQSTT